MLSFFQKKNNAEQDIRDICYTLQTGRRMMEARAAFLVSSVDDLRSKLEEYIDGSEHNEDIYTGSGEVNAAQVIHRRFADETSAKREIESLIGAAEYRTLCKIWAAGISIDWEKIYEKSDRIPRTVSLPSCSFERRSFWAPAELENINTDETYIKTPGVAAEKKQNRFDGCENDKTLLYQEEWVSETIEFKSDLGRDDTVVCFLSGRTAEQKLKEKAALSGAGYRFIFISNGKKFEKTDRFHYTVVSANENDYINCFESIKKDFGTIQGIFYFWSLENPNEASKYYFYATALMIKGFYTAGLKPSQVLLAGGYETPAKRCYAESIIGFEKSSGMILPGVKMRAVCLDSDNGMDEKWISCFLNEYRADGGKSVLYENGIRKTLKLAETQLNHHQTGTLKKGGTYLITGGMGGLGRLFAKWLIRTYNAKLILIGRSGPGRLSDRLMEFRELSPDVLYAQADMCDFAQVESAVKKGIARFGHIDGVIHAAGLESFGNILTKELTAYKKVLAPKTAGTENLIHAVKNQHPDFVCLFSSSAAVLGDFGGCDYAIGNRFLMTAAKYMLKNGRVINWPLWKDGGMGVRDTASIKLYLQSSGQSFLEADKGIELFEQIMNSDLRQVLVISGKKSRVSKFLCLDGNAGSVAVGTSGSQARKKPAGEQETAAKPVTAGKRKGGIMNGWTLEECVLWELKDATEQILDISKNEMEPTDNFADYGYDSITLAEFANQLTGRFTVNITPDIFYSYPSLERLCNYIISEYAEQMEGLYGTDGGQKETAPEEVEPGSAAGKIAAAAGFPPERAGNIAAATFAGAQDADKVAVVGISGKFPGASNVDELWRILEEGREVIKEVPEERREWWAGKDKEKHDYRMGVMPGIDEFDPLFFEISPLEAENMDPQQRLLLQEIWKALENAGYGAKLLESEKIGVFVGSEDGDYRKIVPDDSSITSNNTSMLSARIGYFLNLNGPNMTINTACSSGLSAVHQAALSIRNGECDTAVAAGISLAATSTAFDSMGRAGMLSKDRKCYAFDSRANGMVPAEAVAVVVLKRLSKAVEDRNHVYGVIAGSGINYDGKTNGITAPSGQSQIRLLRSVYDKYRINPENIGYIIAHGTGTRLGDPIEMNALTDTFRGYTSEKQYCAVGSVKANLGHCLAASGVVSLISLFMAMEKQTIPKQINCEKKSDYIKWENSPFYINERNSDWKDTVGSRRMGAVSAFGMGGTNVHVVVESFRPETERSAGCPFYLLVLSAKTERALEQRCLQLAQILQEEDTPLSDMSYTLLEGRSHFQFRIAVVASNKNEAAEMLRRVQDDQPNVYRDKVKKNFKPQEGMAAIVEELQATCLKQNAAETKRSLGALAGFYVQGYEVDGDVLFADKNVCRVKLPVYPFAKEKYWIEEKKLTKPKDTAVKIHPLLGRNISDLSGQKYETIFSGEEPFFKDHVINGSRILPGVAYLEMARAAAKNAAKELFGSGSGIKIKNVGWLSPVVCNPGEGADVCIRIEPGTDESLIYEVYTHPQGEILVHSRGSIEAVDEKSSVNENIEEIKAAGKATASGAACYQIYAGLGMEYGEAFRCIDRMYICADKVLSKIKMPSDPAMPCEGYVLHPGIMDAGLQTAIGFALQRDKNHIRAAVPFALDEVTVFDQCGGDMWAVARRGDSHGKLEKYDVNLCDKTGKVCVRMKGYAAKEPVHPQKERAIMLERFWKPDGTESFTENDAPVKTVYFGVNNPPKDAVSIPVENRVNRPDIDYLSGASAVFAALKEMMTERRGGKKSFQLIVRNDEMGMLYGALDGMLKTAAAENPLIQAKIIEIDRNTSSEKLTAVSEKEKQDTDSRHVVYRNHGRYTEAYRRLEPKANSASPWKDGGVYLITGGAGGLGCIFAEEIASKSSGSVLILTGRSQANEKTDSVLRKIREAGAAAAYYSMDVSDAPAVKDTVATILNEYGKLDGIIHAAGALHDGYILKKTDEELRQVLVPKVSGAVVLDDATKNIPLDFVIYFSSITGAVGNPGQADYAAANAFLSAYAGYRNNMVKSGIRSGKTLSICWPLWKDGGMHVNAETEKILESRSGVIPMPVDAGLKVLYDGWSCGAQEVICLYGDGGRMNEIADELCGVKMKIQAAKMEAPAVSGGSTSEKMTLIRQESANLLKSTLSKVLKIPVDRIEDDDPMEKYGLDSIIVMNLTSELEKEFGVLPKTLFYEYPTLGELSVFFAENYQEMFLSKASAAAAGIPKADETSAEDSFTETERTHGTEPFKRRVSGRFLSAYAKAEEEYRDIAIVGLSGRYPMADNLKEFWNNLQSGKDCITEIPIERWDYRDYEDKISNKKKFSKYGGFLNDVDKFDPLFFHIAPRDAERTDPQERIFLECVYEALEDAGYTRKDIEAVGNVGVFAGSMYSEYQYFGVEEQMKGNTIAYTGTMSSIANRISYFFNLHGPSMAVDTMCSSALTAIYLACDSMKNNHCKMAIAGGVNLSLHPNKYVMLAQNNFASSKGLCASFAEGGDGYVPSEGAGAVILKPLSQAVADGDHIYAVIKAVEANHGGNTSGYSVPNPNAQCEVITKAFESARIEPRTIGYIEAHGTGTALGDPIEITGLTNAFKNYTKDTGFCKIGSVKSNIGHCEGAAGIASLTKVLLQIKHKKIVPSIHSEKLNPFIDFDKTPFTVAQHESEWRRMVIRENGEEKEYPRRAGISGFGAGGSNIHMIVEEWDTKDLTPVARDRYGIILSAKSEEQLKQVASRLLAEIKDGEYVEADLPSIAYTLQTGREPMDCRAAFIVTGLKDLWENLRLFCSGGLENSRTYFSGTVKKSTAAMQHLLEDADFATAVKAWAEKDKLERLLDFWVKGMNIHWKWLYQGNPPVKISLPTYPFLKEVCWAPSGSRKTSAMPAAQDVVNAPDEFETAFIAEHWKQEELTGQYAPVSGVIAWFVSKKETISAIDAYIRNQGLLITPVYISCDTGYSHPSENMYTISRDCEKDYLNAFENIRDAYGRIDGIVYLWPAESEFGSENIAEAAYLFKAVGKYATALSKLILSGIFNHQIEKCYLESLIGFETSKDMVLPGTDVRFIEADGKSYTTAKLIPLLVREYGVPGSEAVLYEDEKRKTPFLERVNARENDRTVLKDGGVYLITGGLGGIGYIVSKWLVEKYHANLVLTGRKLDSNQENKLKRLRAGGTSILFYKADVCDKEKMKTVVDGTKQKFGTINGVFHAAGIDGKGTVLENGISAFDQVIAPKITGTVVLEDVIKNERMDFLCLFSSTSAIFGDFGSCAYAAGNRFLMSFAQYESVMPGTQKIVINWPLWKEGGMGHESESSTAMYMKASGQRLLETDEALRCLDLILSQTNKQCMVLTGKKDKIERMISKKPNLNNGQGRIQAAQAKTPAAIKAGKSGDVKKDLLIDLRRLAGELIKIAPENLDFGVVLAEYGFDSITLGEYADMLAECYGVSITPDIFYRYPTFLKLRDYFMDRHQEEVESHYNKREPVLEVSEKTKTANQKHMPEKRESVEPAQTEPEDVASVHAVEKPKSPDDPVAIIGISGKFPGAENTEELWSVLAEGRTAIREADPNRKGFLNHGKAGEIRKFGSLTGIEEFDPLFFEIPPSEAENIDPRQRLLLQEAWKALENAGYGRKLLSEEEIGVFVGAEDGDYRDISGNDGSITANHNAILAARLAYLLNLKGPNMAINTACSSGLAAVHEACLSIRSGECDTAVAAGVNILFSSESYDMMKQAGMLSESQTCHAFDQRADGMVPGEAIAVVVLKRLSKAIEDKNPILATIAGSGMNYDGKTNGITAPNGEAQVRLLKSVYKRYHINPERLGYIIAHGTGTRLGDPVEMNALTEAFSAYTAKRQFCAVGSVKSNFGHTLAASGVVSLISLVLAMRKKTIPRQINCDMPSDYIRWGESQFYINRDNKRWEGDESNKRLGAVSAFGMGGTNVHVVVESWPESEENGRSDSHSFSMIAISAKTKQALENKCRDLKYALGHNTDMPMRDVCYTLLEGRKHFAHRLAVIASDRQEAVWLLDHVNERHGNVVTGQVKRSFIEADKDIDTIKELEREYSAETNAGKARQLLTELAGYYCCGYEIDGNALYQGEEARRIQLPNYPFAKGVYWSNAKKGHDGASVSESSADKITDAETMCEIGSHSRVETVDSKEKTEENPPVQNDGDLKSKAVQFLRDTVSVNLKIPPEFIEDDDPLDEFGLDSTIVLSLTKKMEDTFGTLPKTLFYQYPTIHEMADFFVKKHAHELGKPGVRQNSETPEKPAAAVSAAAALDASVKLAVSGAQKHSQNEPDQSGNRDIAIIGIAGHYPKARTLKEFWNNLASGKDCVDTIPADRWNYKLFYDPNHSQKEKSYLKDGGFINGAYEFDPLFFSISPKEAKALDPQERLFLECVYETFEDAGYTKEKLSKINSSGIDGNVGVYVGVMWEEYQLYGAQEQILGNPVCATGYQASIANRCSYFFNLHGPSMAVDTMCSSSMTAIHLACQSLRTGECEAAIAGGVNLSIHPNKYLLLSKNQFASERGMCESFGDKGDGYVPGEGVGAVMLKPFDRAVQDGDHIYGVIKGTAVNHGGKTSSYTVPNPNAQAEVIGAALQKANVDPRTLTYIEAHGTGTSLGDPIEIAGLTKAFESFTQDKQFCAIGSVKSNIGHLEGAAGIAGLTKVLLQMKHEQLVPSIHAETLNPYIDFDSSPFRVSRSNSQWERPVLEENGTRRKYPLRAGVSAFGAGGSNAHIIVEEYVPGQERYASMENREYAFVLSARTKEQLKQMAARLYEMIADNYRDPKYLCSIAYTLQTGREPLNYRLGVVASNIRELFTGLKAYIEGNGTQATGVFFDHVKRNKRNLKLAADRNTKDRIAYLLKHGDQSELVKLWVGGGDVNWETLYRDFRPVKISLPTYPFARDRYDVLDKTIPYLFGTDRIPDPDPEPVQTVNAHQADEKAAWRKSNSAAAGDERSLKLMTFREEWSDSESCLVPVGKKIVACFACDESIKQTVISEAEMIGQEITLVWVSCGESYRKLSENSYVIAREQTEDYEQCLKNIKADFGGVDNILYLNPLEDKAYLEDSCGIVNIIKGMYGAKTANTGLIVAGGYENGLEYAYAQSWIGIEKSFKLVMETAFVKIVIGDKNELAYGDFIHLLLGEMYDRDRHSVLYVSGKRKTLAVLPSMLDDTGESLLKERGAYLLTGGLGGLGTIFGEWLAKTYHARLVLTGRRSPETVRDQLSELERKGIEAIYVQADVCDARQIRRAIEAAISEYGRLDGVLHVAGVEQSVSIMEKSIEDYRKVISPKVQGTLALEKALEGIDIDFICYFSSSSAIIGDFGTCDYAVGNRFLMGYAEYRNGNRKLPGRALVINWPLWKDGGMGFATDAASRMYLKISGQGFLEKDEGTKLFDRVMKDKSRECLVMVGEENRINKILGVDGKAEKTAVKAMQTGIVVLQKTDEAENIKKVPDADAKEAVKERDLKMTQQSNVYEKGKGFQEIMKDWSLSQCVLWDLKNMIHVILSVPFSQMDEDLNLADFGFDSVTLAEYAEMIGKKMEITVTPDLFYSYPTLNELTGCIADSFAEKLKQFYNKGGAQRQEPAGVKADTAEPADGASAAQAEHVAVETEKSGEYPVYEKSRIAIIGISGKFPDANSPEELWNILKDGKEVIHEVPEDRIGWQENRRGMKMGVVEGIDEFDPAFFEISPREAQNMDPRQRLLLEETWKALEDAGIGETDIQNGKIGMFVGAEDGDYQLLGGKGGNVTSNHNAIMAARLSYFLNLNGPNMSINTACSSGLVAVHQACQSLRTMECGAAVAAGVNLLCTPIGYEQMDAAGMLSQERRCYAFDQRANGMVPAEGVAVVVLKRLSDAERDNDTIYGVIEGSGINYDGKTNGITAPSGRAQTMLLKEVYERYQIDPGQISYIVAHGTGTRIGDPIEINALRDAFWGSDAQKGSCALTSTKSNIGHSLAASGIVSLISLLLAFKHETIPACINCENRSEYIHWEDSPFYLNMKNRVWKDSAEKRRIGAVNAFGMSGTNAHVVVGSYQPKTKAVKKVYSHYLLALSAKTPGALAEKCKNLIRYLETDSRNTDLSDISYTLFNGRQHFALRMAVLASDKASAANLLKQAAESGKVPNVYYGNVKRDFKPQRVIQNMVDDLCISSRNAVGDEERYGENLNALAEFYCMGYSVKGTCLYFKDDVSKVPVPAYPFNNKKYWVQSEEPTGLVKNDGNTAAVGKTVVRKQKQAFTAKPVPRKSDTTQRAQKPEIERAVAEIAVAKPAAVKKTDKKTEPALSSEKLITALSESLAAELYMDASEIDLGKSFMEMGLDSIIGVEWVNHINKHYGLSISSTKIYQYPNLVDFAAFILSQAGGVQGMPAAREKRPGETPETVAADDAAVKKPGTETASAAMDMETLMNELAVSLAKELYMDVQEVEYDKSFMEMGLDSIVGVEWMRDVNKQYHTTIASTKIYQYPTIIELAGYILKRIANEVPEAPNQPENIPQEENEVPADFSLKSLNDPADFEIQKVPDEREPIFLDAPECAAEEKEIPENAESAEASSDDALNEMLYQLYRGEIGIESVEKQFVGNK